MTRIPSQPIGRRSLMLGALTGAGALTLGTLHPSTAQAHGGDRPRPASYLLTGNEQTGSKFEGIGVDQRRGRFYVSEVTGGAIHRGSAQRRQTSVWLPGNGTDGRFTARGITVDRAGRAYIAGGPNGLDTTTGADNGRPDLWIYSPGGTLLAALKAPGQGAFLNDVWIGPDGAAYVTNSNAAQLFRVARERGRWQLRLWADASDTISTAAGFNLGGIVASPDQRALVVAQGNLGLLWRFDLRTRRVSAVDQGGAELKDADGLVLQGNRLTVVQNFSRQLAELRLSADGRRATLISQRPTAASRVLTTAKALDGRILYVDSHFDQQQASGPYEVITDPFSAR